MDDVLGILNRIISVLEESSEGHWLKTFDKISKNYETLTDDEKIVYRRKLLRIYGGMGSFSDLVLYKNNKVLYKENNELDALRKDLFEELRKGL